MAALDALILRVGQEDRHSALPVALYTGTGDDPRPRLRCDPSDTAFFEGRQFRVFHEFNVATGQSVWLRFITTKDVIIKGRDVTVVEGRMRFALGTGGTPGGTWTPKTVFPVNATSDVSQPVYVASTTSAFGGTNTGMSERDLLLIETPNAAGQAVAVNLGIPEVGLPVNTYYVEIRNTGNGALRGLYRVFWEEREPRSPRLY